MRENSNTDAKHARMASLLYCGDLPAMIAPEKKRDASRFALRVLKSCVHLDDKNGGSRWRIAT